MEEELFLEYPEYIEANNIGQVGTREYGIEGRYNWRGSPYHLIIHTLQTFSPYHMIDYTCFTDGFALPYDWLYLYILYRRVRPTIWLYMLNRWVRPTTWLIIHVLQTSSPYHMIDYTCFADGFALPYDWLYMIYRPVRPTIHALQMGSPYHMLWDGTSFEYEIFVWCTVQLPRIQ